LIYWSATLAIAIVLTVFAVPNRERVDVVLWPFLTLEAPLYLVTLLALLAGFLVGAVARLRPGVRARELGTELSEIARAASLAT